MYVHPLISSLPESVRQAVGSAAVLRSFRKSEIVLDVGQNCGSIYCVGSGLLRVVSTGSGDTDLTTHFLKPDEIHLGPDLTRKEYPSEVRLVAALPSSVYLVPRQYLRALCEAYPTVALTLLDITLGRIQTMGRQMRRVATLSAEQIVGRALFDLTQQRPDGTRVLDKRIPQSVIASYAGLSRPVVNKVVKEMEGKGLLQRADDVFMLSERLGKSTDFDSLPPDSDSERAEGQSKYASPDFDMEIRGPRS